MEPAPKKHPKQTDAVTRRQCCAGDGAETSGDGGAICRAAHRRFERRRAKYTLDRATFGIDARQTPAAGHRERPLPDREQTTCRADCVTSPRSQLTAGLAWGGAGEVWPGPATVGGCPGAPLLTGLDFHFVPTGSCMPQAATVHSHRGSSTRCSGDCSRLISRTSCHCNSLCMTGRGG